MLEPGRQRSVAADQFGGGEAMSLCLHDPAIVDRAELADRAIDRRDEVRLRQRTDTVAQRAGEEGVERRIARRVGIGRFGHVDTIAADKPADQPRRPPAGLRPCDGTGEAGQLLFGKKMLNEDIEMVGHGNS